MERSQSFPSSVAYLWSQERQYAYLRDERGRHDSHSNHLEGSLAYEVEGRPTVTLKPGDVLFIPAGTIHAAKALGSGKGVELATYIAEKGKPLLTMVK